MADSRKICRNDLSQKTVRRALNRCLALTKFLYVKNGVWVSSLQFTNGCVEKEMLWFGTPKQPIAENTIWKTSRIRDLVVWLKVQLFGISAEFLHTKHSQKTTVDSMVKTCILRMWFARIQRRLVLTKNTTIKRQKIKLRIKRHKIKGENFYCWAALLFQAIACETAWLPQCPSSEAPAV